MNECREDLRDLIPAYALGALDPEETRKLEDHLRVGCDPCREELQANERIASQLALAATPRPPASSLRDRILEQVPQSEARVEKDGVAVVRTARLESAALRPEGFEVHTLSTDDEGNATLLFRMRPGGHLPRHRHACIEESVVLEGELVVNGMTMMPGDYCRAEPESLHDSVYSTTGCVFLVMCKPEAIDFEGS